MIATLKFKLPEENGDFQDALDGGKLRGVIWDLDQWLRSKIKYEELPEAVGSAYQSVRDKTHELAKDHGVEL